MNNTDTQQMEVNPLAVRFRLSEQSQSIERLLQSVEIGQLASYPAIIAAAGCEVDRGIGPVKAWLESARKRLQRQRKIVFEVEPTVGLRRIVNGQVIEAGNHQLKKSRRAVKRSVGLVICCDFKELTPVEQRQVLTLQATSGAILLASSGATQRALTKKLEEGRELKNSRVIHLFKTLKA